MCLRRGRVVSFTCPSVDNAPCLEFGGERKGELTANHQRKAGTAFGDDLMALVRQVGDANTSSSLGCRHCLGYVRRGRGEEGERL